MTVIDYVPVGGEVKLNILLGETKKYIISKVMACITPLSLYIDLDKQRYTRAVRQPVACRFKGIMFARVLCVDGTVGLRAGVSLARHSSALNNIYVSPTCHHGDCLGTAVPRQQALQVSYLFHLTSAPPFHCRRFIWLRENSCGSVKKSLVELTGVLYRYI